MRLDVWLFGGPEYYPSGGMNDLIGRYPSLSSATAAAVEAELQGRVEWWQIVSATCGTILMQSTCLPYGANQPPAKK